MSNQANQLKEMSEQTAQLLQHATEKTSQTVLEQTQKYNDAYSMTYSTIMKIVDGFWERVPYIVIGLLVFLLSFLISKLFKKFIEKALSKRFYNRQNLILVLYRVGSTFIVFLGFLISLVIIIPGFSPGQLISALGIGSVAIGFAFKDIFQNLLSGILILIGEPFRIGDDIIVNGMEGTVEDIQIRATFLRSLDGRRLVIPNATVYTSAITVNTAYPRRRCEFTVGIGYDDDIDQARSIIMEILNNNRTVLGNPAFSVNVAALADFSVNLVVRWWVDTKEVGTSTSISTIQEQVKNAFNREKISIPYPIQEIKVLNEQTRIAQTSEAK